MGIRNAMPVDKRVFDFYVETLKRLARLSTFTGAGIGRDALTVACWAMAAGGHLRTGMEDNLHLDRHTLAPYNAALVRQVVSLMPDCGRQPATVAESRVLQKQTQCATAAPRRETNDCPSRWVSHAPSD